MPSAIIANSLPWGLISMIMALDKIGTIGTACTPNFGCVRGTKNCFFEFLAGNSPFQPYPLTYRPKNNSNRAGEFKMVPFWYPYPRCTFAANLDTTHILILSTLFTRKGHRPNRFVLAFVGKSKKYQNRGSIKISYTNTHVLICSRSTWMYPTNYLTA